MFVEEIQSIIPKLWTQSVRHRSFCLSYTILFYTILWRVSASEIRRNSPETLLFCHFFLWKPFNSTVSASETHQKLTRNPSEIQLISRKSCESVRWNQLTAQSMSKSNPMTTKWSPKFQSISVDKYHLNSSTAWFQTTSRQRQNSELGTQWKKRSSRILEILVYNPFIYEKPYIHPWKR